MGLSVRLRDVTFAKALPYFVCAQLDKSKRARTEVSEASTGPVFRKVFDEFEIRDRVEQELVLEAFCVVGDEDATQLLGSCLLRFSGRREGTTVREVEFLSSDDVAVGRACVEMRFSNNGRLKEDKKDSFDCEFILQAHFAVMTGSPRRLRFVAATVRGSRASTEAAECDHEGVADWNENLSFRLSPSVFRDASVYLDVEDADSGKRLARTMIPFKRLKANEAYTLDLRWKQISVLVTLFKQSPGHFSYFALSKLELRFKTPPAGRIRAVVRLVDAAHVDADSGLWLRSDRNSVPSFPCLVAAAEDGALLTSIRVDDAGHLDGGSSRKPTLLAACDDDGRVIFDDTSAMTFAAPEKKSFVAVVEIYDDNRHFLGWAMVPLLKTPDFEASAPILRHESEAQSLLDVDQRLLGHCTATFAMRSRSDDDDSRCTPWGQDFSDDIDTSARRRRNSCPEEDTEDLVKDLSGAKVAVARLSSDLEARDQTISDLRERCRQLDHEKKRLLLEWQEREALGRRDFETMQKFLENDESLATIIGRRKNKSLESQFRLLAMMYRQVKTENDGLLHLQTEERRLRKQLKQSKSANEKLEGAHRLQRERLQRLEKESEKTSAYKTTIKMQEQVIAKLETLVDAKLREICRRRIDEANSVEAQLDNLKSRATSTMTDAEAAAQAADNAKRIAAKDATIASLEGSLADEKHAHEKDLAKLKLKLFELEMMNEYGRPPPIIDGIDMLGRMGLGPASPEAEPPPTRISSSSRSHYNNNRSSSLVV